MALSNRADKELLLLLCEQRADVSRLQDIFIRHFDLLAGEIDAATADGLIESDPPALILLDSAGNVAQALTVCAHLKQQVRLHDVPLLVLADWTDAAFEEAALEAGAADFLLRPFHAGLVLARVRTHVALAAAQRRALQHDREMEEELARRAREVLQMQDSTILAMASLAEARDSDTSNHILRTQRYVRALGWKLSTHPRFKEYLTPAKIALLYKAAPLHDIGKVGLPDRVLLKMGKLNEEEFEVMKTHTTLGRDALEKVRQVPGGDSEFLAMAGAIAYSHHEKWDGSGYPQGLAGDAIPVPARLMALADVYDALISRRVYKEPMSHTDAVNIIEQVRGKHLDADVVDAFVAIQDQFQGIAMSFWDSAQDLQNKIDYIENARLQ